MQLAPIGIFLIAEVYVNIHPTIGYQAFGHPVLHLGQHDSSICCRVLVIKLVFLGQLYIEGLENANNIKVISGVAV